MLEHIGACTALIGVAIATVHLPARAEQQRSHRFDPTVFSIHAFMQLSFHSLNFLFTDAGRRADHDGGVVRRCLRSVPSVLGRASIRLNGDYTSRHRYKSYNHMAQRAVRDYSLPTARHRPDDGGFETAAQHWQLQIYAALARLVSTRNVVAMV